ncbi:RHS repeat protein [Salmonella enterica subsp. enterica]|nr:RHS repeat protein [Salmonella enterica subsp. enterica]
MTACTARKAGILHFSYNRRGRLTAVRDSGGRETRYDYNGAGDANHRHRSGREPH